MAKAPREIRARSSFFVIASVLAVCAPRSASAEDANGLGEKHQLILSADRLVPAFSYSSQTVTTPQGNGGFLKTTDSGTSIALLFGREPSLGTVHTLPRVAFDFTIVPRLTLGGAFAFATGLGGSHEEQLPNNTTRKSDADKVSVLGVAPRVGYVVPLGDVFAFWPRGGIAFYSVSSKSRSIGQGGIEVTTTDTDSVLSLDLDPQFAWVPIRHFFIHFGPIVNIPMSGSRSREVAAGLSTGTTKNDMTVFHFGVSAGLGGFFDL